MNEKVLSPSTPETTVDYEAAIKQYFAEMKRLNAQMNNDRIDIERLKAETETLKTETRALLATLGAGEQASRRAGEQAGGSKILGTERASEQA